MTARIDDFDVVAFDADDTLCHAIAAAKDGVVDWPVDEYSRWYSPKDCHCFDQIMQNPWWLSQDVRSYIEGFGIAQGHNWGDLGRADMTTFTKDTQEVDTPLGRTYNAYSNIVFANLEGSLYSNSRRGSNFAATRGLIAA